MVLNAAARLVVGAGKFDRITPVLRDVLEVGWPSAVDTVKTADATLNCIR